MELLNNESLLSSTNGTFINDEKLGRNNEIELRNGMEVTVCPKRAGVLEKVTLCYPFFSCLQFFVHFVDSDRLHLYP